jgi:hypothetical protein
MGIPEMGFLGLPDALAGYSKSGGTPAMKEKPPEGSVPRALITSGCALDQVNGYAALVDLLVFTSGTSVISANCVSCEALGMAILSAGRGVAGRVLSGFLGRPLQTNKEPVEGEDLRGLQFSNHRESNLTPVLVTVSSLAAGRAQKWRTPREG